MVEGLLYAEKDFLNFKKNPTQRRLNFSDFLSHHCLHNKYIDDKDPLEYINEYIEIFKDDSW